MIIFVRATIALGLCVLAYTGYTDVFQVDQLKKFDIDSINYELSEKNRYVQVDKGYVTNQYAVEMNTFDKELPLYIYYPLISKEEYKNVLITKLTNNYTHSETQVNIPITVIVRRDATKLDRNCLIEKSCISELYQQQGDSGLSVKGLTNIGEYAVVPSIRKELKKMGFEIPDKVVVLEENYEPSSSWIGWLKLIGGVLGVVLVIGSYFQRSN